MAVGASESRLTGAAEVPSRQADAAAVGTAHIGGDVPHPLLGAIGCHSYGATVNHLRCEKWKKKEEMISRKLEW